MLYVRVELWPRGDRSKARLLGEANIANTGAGTDARGAYVAALSHKRTKLWRGPVHLFGFPRKRLNAWDLLYRCLRAMVGDRNEEPRR